MSDSKKRNADSGLADELLERLKKVDETATEAMKSAQETAENVGYIASTIRKVGAGFSWMNEKIFSPVGKVIPFAKPIARSVGNAYSWFCHPSEPLHKAVWRGMKNKVGAASNTVANLFRSKDNKEAFTPSLLAMGEFSRSRAGIAALVTTFALSPLLNRLPIVGDFVPEAVSETASSILYEPPHDAFRMSLTALFNGGSLQHDTIYLNGKNEIVPENDVWSVGGCESSPKCDATDAITFHIKPSVMHHAWSLSTGHGFFLPDYVATPIPNVPSKCDVVSYGSRWRVSKWLNSYPQLLSAQCSPLPTEVSPTSDFTGASTSFPSHPPTELTIPAAANAASNAAAAHEAPIPANL